jgi:hypothetical protein
MNVIIDNAHSIGLVGILRMISAAERDDRRIDFDSRRFRYTVANGLAESYHGVQPWQLLYNTRL